MIHRDQQGSEHQSRFGYGIAIVFGALSMIGFGPHKLFAANAAEIFPAVVVGFALSCAVIAMSVMAWRSQ